MLDPISTNISQTSHLIRMFDFVLFVAKQVLYFKNQYHNSKKSVSQFKLSGNAHLRHFVLEKGEINNSKNMGGLRIVSRY